MEESLTSLEIRFQKMWDDIDHNAGSAPDKELLQDVAMRLVEQQSTEAGEALVALVQIRLSHKHPALAKGFLDQIAKHGRSHDLLRVAKCLADAIGLQIYKGTAAVEAMKGHLALAKGVVNHTPLIQQSTAATILLRTFERFMAELEN